MQFLQTGNQGQGHSSGPTLQYTGDSEVAASQIKSVLCIPDIPDRHYCLRSPIQIEVEKEGSGYIISHPRTGVFSYHDDLTVALGQFYEAFVEQYEFLNKHSNQLSPSLSRELQIFESLLRPY